MTRGFLWLALGFAYQEKAGPYSVFVIFKPPGVIPGLAEISVRVDDVDRRERLTVTVLPVHSATSAWSPPPDIAKLVRGETHVYHAALWLMESGAYSVFVDVVGPDGSGIAIVPINAVATRRLPMPVYLAVILIALSVLLALGLLAIIAAAVRESVLLPGGSPSRRRVLLSRCAMAATAGLLGLALFGWSQWWQKVDSRHAAQLFRPSAVAADIREEGSQSILRSRRANSGAGTAWFGRTPRRSLRSKASR
jgi:hypothetical protein